MSYIIGRGRYARETYPQPPSGGAGCSIQFCSDYERDDRIELAEAAGFFLLPRQQGVTDEPIRCEFTQWTPGSYLQVHSAIAFNLRQRDAIDLATMVGSFVLALMPTSGGPWSLITRTGRSMAQVVTSLADTPEVGAATSSHAHLIGPLPEAPTIAIAATWSISTGAGMETGRDAASDIFNDVPAGISLECAEVSADCVTAAQPPELLEVPIVDPVFVAPA